MSSRPTLLCLSTYFPWPADAGGSLRVDGLVRALAKDYDVRVLVPREHDALTTQRLIDGIEAELGITVETYAGPRTTRSRFQAGVLWLQAFAARIPPWIYGNVDRDLVRRLPELASEADAIVLLEDFMGLYPLLARVTLTAPIIADKHVVLARPRFETDVRGGWRRWLTRSFERRYLNKVDHVVVTTSEDAQWLRRLYAREPDAVIPTGIELPAPRASRSGERNTIAWLSALDVQDNLTGLESFVRAGWPLLAAHGYELQVAGRNPSDRVRYLDDVVGVKVLGQIGSVPEFLAGVDVAVIPLWSGRGIKVKTLTLMAAGLPVAATPMALEGMLVEPGRHCLVGQTPEELAGHVHALLRDAALADSIAAAGREFVASTYTWDSVGPRFVAVVQQALDRAT